MTDGQRKHFIEVELIKGKRIWFDGLSFCFSCPYFVVGRE